VKLAKRPSDVGVVAPEMSWRIQFLIPAATSAIVLAVVWRAFPESPRWLESKGRYGEANEILDRIERSIESRRGIALAPVAEVRVERHFPHTIEITVTERTLAYVWMDGNAARWVDANGVVFHEGGETAQGIVKANIAAPDQRLLKDVATVVSAVVPVLGDRITLLQASAVDRIEIQLSDGDTVVWGSAEQSQVKAQVLSVLLSQDASVYDVSAPHAPTTR